MDDVYAIWFWLGNPGSGNNYGGNGMKAQILHHSKIVPVFNYNISVNVTQWHIYEIRRYDNAVIFLIDNTTVAQYNGSMTTDYLRSEAWIDNGLYHDDGTRTYSDLNRSESVYLDWVSHNTTADHY